MCDFCRMYDRITLYKPSYKININLTHCLNGSNKLNQMYAFSFYNIRIM